MYTLTLTSEERKAIDFVGHRYRHGDELSFLLIKCIPEKLNEVFGETAVWQDPGDITFYIPEYRAWDIKEIIEEDNGSLACFATNFKAKLFQFAEKIV